MRDAIKKDYFVVVARDCIADNPAALTEVCLPAFERLLSADGLTSADELTATWTQQ